MFGIQTLTHSIFEINNLMHSIVEIQNLTHVLVWNTSSNTRHKLFEIQHITHIILEIQNVWNLKSSAYRDWNPTSNSYQVRSSKSHSCHVFEIQHLTHIMFVEIQHLTIIICWYPKSNSYRSWCVILEIQSLLKMIFLKCKF